MRGQEDEVEERGAVKTFYHRGHRGTQRKIELIEMSQLMREKKLSSSLCYSVSSVVEI